MFDENMPVRVAIYTRVSTDEQKFAWYWMQTQEDALRKIIDGYKKDSKNWVLDEKLIFRDDWYSWGDLKRKWYNDMMAMVREKKIDVIAVYKIDRISRNLTHLLAFFEEIQKYGASFFSLKEDIDFSGPIGRLTFQIFWALAEFERETIRTRTAEGKITSARNGNFVSNAAPYWYTREGNKKTGKWKVLEVVSEETKWVKTIFEWFVYDGMNYSQIARELNKIKLPKWKWSLSKNKLSLWYDSDVTDILCDSTYNWISVTRLKDGNWDVQEIRTIVPRTVSETLFLLAYHKIKDVKETKWKKWGWKNIYLLSRKLFYKESWRWFVWYPRAKWGFWYRHKKFIDSKSWKEFENIEIPAAVLDDFVWDTIKMAINKPKEFYKLYQKQTIQEGELESYLRNQDNYIASINENESAIISLEDEYLKWKISEERKDILLKRYEDSIRESRTRLIDLEDKIWKLLEAKASQEALERFSKNFKNTLESLNAEQKRVIVDMLVDGIEVYKIDWEIRADIFFRFAKSRVENQDIKDEPTQGSNKQKSPLSENFSSNLEAPSGVEPDSTALQAAV